VIAYAGSGRGSLDDATELNGRFLSDIASMDAGLDQRGDTESVVVLVHFERVITS
jgi:hypothetical protein